MKLNNPLKILLSLAFALIIGLIIFLPLQKLFEFIHPPITSDGLHTVMPIGQMMLSGFLSIIISIFIFVYLIRKIYKK